MQQYRGNISPTNIYEDLNSDGNFHFFSEAEAINRQLAISLNRELTEFGNRSRSGPTAASRSDLAIAGFSVRTNRGRSARSAWSPTTTSWRNRERVERDVADPMNLVENKFRTINQVSATTVVNLGFSFMSDHEISTSSFFLRNSEDESAISTRYNNNFQHSDGLGLRDYDIRFEERELMANQIRGHHVIGARHARSISSS